MFVSTLKSVGPYLGSALALIALSLSAHAETSSLPTVKITGTRLVPDETLIASSSVVLTQDEIEALNASTLSDVLDTIAGVNGRRFYGLNNSRTSIDMLGFGVTGTQNTLVLLNGRKINPIDQAAVDFSTIPVKAIKRIEVTPASGAVLYGSGSVGGAINIITHNSHATSGGFSATSGDYGSSGGNAYASTGNQSASIFAAMQTWETEGYRDNNEAQQHSGFVDFRINREDFSAGVSVLADDQKVRLPGARTVNPGTNTNEIETDPQGATTPNDWADQQTLQVLPSFRRTISDQLYFQLDAGFQTKEQQYFIDQGFGFTNYAEAISHSNDFGFRFAGNNEHYQWTAGLDYRATDFRRKNSLNEVTFDQPIHDVKIDQEVRALYALSKFFIGEQTSITAGARHEWIGTKAIDQYDALAPTVPCCGDSEAAPFNLEQDAGLYNLGLRHFFADTLSYFINVEHNARYANVDEFFELDPNAGFISSLDPLEIQTGRLWSTGLSWQNGNQQSTLTGWQGEFKNEIIYDPAASENINLDDTKRYGVSLNSNWQLDSDIAFIFNLSYQRARFDDGPYAGNEVPVVPRQTGFAQFNWQVTDVALISLSQRYVGKKYFDNDQDNDFGQRIPSYRWTDLILSVNKNRKNQPWAEFAVYNIQDVDNAYDYGVSSSFTPGVYNGYPLPAKTLMMTLGWEF